MLDESISQTERDEIAATLRRVSIVKQQTFVRGRQELQLNDVEHRESIPLPEVARNTTSML